MSCFRLALARVAGLHRVVSDSYRAKPNDSTASKRFCQETGAVFLRVVHSPVRNGAGKAATRREL